MSARERATPAQGRAPCQWSWESGKISPFQGGLSLRDRGFRYGQHVFESIAIRNGKALLACEHLELLAMAARNKGIPLSPSRAKALRAFLAKISLPDGMLRIYLSAGEGAPASPIHKPGLYLTWDPVHFPTAAELSSGIKLTVLKKPFLGEEWGVKSGNYEAHLQAFEAAHALGADEGVVLDGKGRVLSCAMGNLLVWLPSRSGLLLVTPQKKGGARSGSLLGWVQRHTKVSERNLDRADLSRAVAMAVTNSRLGVMPVSFFEGKKLSDHSLALPLAKEYLRAHGLLGST